MALSLYGAVSLFYASPVLTTETSSNVNVTQEQEAQVLFNKGLILYHFNRVGQAQAVLEELVYRFKKSKDHDIQK